MIPKLTGRFRLAMAAVAAIIIAIALTATSHSGASAQDAPLSPEKRIAVWDKTAAEVDQALGADAALSAERLSDLRGLLLEQRSQASALRETLSDALRPLQTQLEALGAAPEDGADEDADLARRRAALVDQITALEARLKEVGLAEARADALQTRLSARERARFTSQLLSKGPTVVDTDAWGALADDAPKIGAQLGAAALEASAEFDAFGADIPITLAILAALLIVFVVRPRCFAIARRLEAASSQLRNPVSRIAFSCAEFLFRAAPLPAVAFGLAAVVSELGALSAVGALLMRRIVESLAIMSATTAFAYMAFRASAPGRRLVELPPPADAVVANSISGLAALIVLHRLSLDVLEALAVSPPTLVIVNALAALATAPLLIVLAARVPRRQGPEPEQPTLAGLGELDAGPPDVDWRDGGALLLRVGLQATAVALLISATLGYYALARFLLEAVALTALLGVACALVFVAVEALLAPKPPLADDQAVDEKRVGDALPGEESGGTLVRLSVALILAVVAAPFLGLIWGASESDIRAFADLVFGGVQVGDTVFSLTDALWAILVLVFGIWLTRIAQRVLNRSVLPGLRVDRGARMAIGAGVGYAGFILTGLLAISATGVDLSNLAIIAGALSVGIGFGLQNIVNNFVSGLILLIERPIQIGDWIEVGEFSGNVKQINVRSTEIQTFDRSSVIVPNSELISSAVVNWTHKSQVGRAIVGVGVGYNSDPTHIRRILSEVALEHPLVLKAPPPFIFFKDFGASSLDFEIRCFLRDINQKLSVESELRYRLLERLRQEGVEIPFPQRDVKIKHETAYELPRASD